MKIVNVLFLIITLCGTTFAQNNQFNGITVEQSSGNLPVPNVTIRSSQANPITSALNGTFTLKFQDHFAGTQVMIQVKKEGWEVVNEKELNTVIPSNYLIRPLKIVLCKAGTLAQNRIRYYNISVNYINKRFEQEIIKAKQGNKNWQEKVAQLNRDRDNLYNQAEQLAERYSRVNFDDVSKIEKQAFDLYQDGKIKEAIELLETVDSEDIIKKAKAQKQKWKQNKDSTDKQSGRINSVLKADSLLKNK